MQNLSFYKNKKRKWLDFSSKVVALKNLLIASLACIQAISAV
jgi:hypothetical protein